MNFDNFLKAHFVGRGISRPRGSSMGLAFLKRFARNRMFWPFGLFECLQKLHVLKPVLDKSEQKLQYVMKFLL
jgi:hypothetical protein